MRFAVYMGVVILCFLSCRKEPLITQPDAKLEFSADTVTFDTVFTSVGSTTIPFKVYNRHNRPIRISSVRITGGAPSQFRLNVDGVPGKAFTDVDILADDSIYVFVQVTVDPTSQATPFVIEDEIVFVTNGNTQEVKLIAWGQNAHFFNAEKICDTTWTDDKPYVIFNYVLVDSNCTLTVGEGVDVFLYSGASLLVLGTLKINGTMDSVVTFQGARLESFYKTIPGQWFGIVLLRGSTGNTINYLSIRNAVYGISVGSFLDGQEVSGLNAPDLTVHNTIISNSAAVGIFGFLGIISAENVLVYHCGLFSVQAELGGAYDFTHCTFANYSTSNLSHEYPVLRISDFFEDDEGNINIAGLDATFANTVIYGEGSNAEEMSLEMKGDTSNFHYFFSSCLLKTKLNTSDLLHYNSVIKNLDPLFADRSKEDFHILTASPCNNSGKAGAGILGVDLEGTVRGAIPDMGVYESGN